MKRAALRRLIRRRARGRCEYCRFPEMYSALVPFHIEHVLAKKHGGRTILANLAYACHHCNYFKGTDMTGIDPLTGKTVKLFHPRRHWWDLHFAWSGPMLIGLTARGRATICTLRINHAEAVKDRQALIAEGLFP